MTARCRPGIVPTLLILLSAGAIGCGSAERSDGERVLLIVVDGLRPDYVTPEWMPNLSSLRDEGFGGDDHHSVVPTVTRVNASSIVTGAYPHRHGITGNSMYVPAVTRGRAIVNGTREGMRAIEAAYGGELLTAPSLGEILDSHGKVLFGASSGSAGSAFVLNHRAPSGGVVHTDYAHPDTLEPVVVELLGPFPREAPAELRIRRAIDALILIGVDRLDADALIVWVTQPDGAAHSDGPGAPSTLEMVRRVDGEIGRLLGELDARGIRSSTNILVTSDHGFSTATGAGPSYGSLLVEQGLKSSPASDDVVFAGSAIHVNEGGEERTRAIVELLQRTPSVGPIFTRPANGSSTQGTATGTLSLSTLLWDHPRAGDILVFPDWTDDENDFGFAGMVTAGGGGGRHGTVSPYEIRATLIAIGPDIKSGVRSAVPTGNVDLAPTMLRLLGIPIPESMEGRVLMEAIVGGPDPSDTEVARREYAADATWEGGGYRVVIHRSEVDGTPYVDFAEVARN